MSRTGESHPVAALLFAAVALASACGQGVPGGNDDSGAAPEAGPEEVVRAPEPDERKCLDPIEPAESILVLEMQDNEYHPDCIMEIQDEVITLELRNTGEALHNFSAAAVDLDQDVEPGTSATIKVDLSRGPVGFVCKYHEPQMGGALFPVEEE